MSEQITIEYPEPEFQLLESTLGGLPAIVVINTALVRFSHRAVFPFSVAVAIEAVALASNGMPSADEVHVLDDVGDEIERDLNREWNVVFVARQTWNGRRELLIYANNAEAANAALSALAARPGVQREWSYEIKPDEVWSSAAAYFQLLDV